jgi:hypothetical protein
MYHDFKPSSFSWHCSSKYITIPLNANLYPMIPESSRLQKPAKRFSAQLENDETQGIVNTALGWAILMSNGLFLNPLLLNTSMALLKLD